MDEGVRQGRLAYALLLARDGTIIASSSRTPAAAVRAIRAQPEYVLEALRGRPYALSNAQRLSEAGVVIGFAQPFDTHFGRRVVVSGVPAQLLYRFVGGYLSQLPGVKGGGAYVLDQLGAVVGSPQPDARPGEVVPERGLLGALARHARGSFAGGRYFASSPVLGSSWRVVLTAPKSRLLASVNGSAKWLPWVLFAAFALAAGAALLLLGRFLRSAADLAAANERYGLAISGANDGIWDLDVAAGRLYISPRGKALLGHSDSEIGDAREEWLDRVHPDDLGPLRAAIDAHVEGRSPHFEIEHRMRHRDGTYRWILARGVAIRDQAGNATRAAGSLSDVTERKLAEERMLHDALHDPLTGLPNRALFVDRLSLSLARGQRRPSRCAVAFLDIDRFKFVNDAFNHSIGDRLLVAFARRLTTVLRPGDTVARFGGDEFAILLDDAGTAREAEDIIRRIQRTLNAPFHIERRELFVSASVGVALSRPDSRPEELLRDADIAMYEAKREGTGRCAIFNAQMHRLVVGQLELELELRTVIEEQRLRVFYQPIIDLGTGRLTGFEALARWPATEDSIDPSEFIAVAEETGLIGQLGRLVLNQACAQLATWRQRGVVDASVTMSVNVSGKQIGASDLAGEATDALQRAGLAADALRLEITESTMLDRPHRLRQVLDELGRIGIGTQIDDFGTGYSSLTFLQHFPGDAIKIDRSFIASMHTNKDSETIVRAIIALAHNLRLEVIAEGVNHAAQLKKLRALGCEYAQGYLIAEPLEANAVESFIAGARPGLDFPAEHTGQANVGNGGTTPRSVLRDRPSRD